MFRNMVHSMLIQPDVVARVTSLPSPDVDIAWFIGASSSESVVHLDFEFFRHLMTMMMLAIAKMLPIQMPMSAIQMARPSVPTLFCSWCTCEVKSSFSLANATSFAN